MTGGIGVRRLGMNVARLVLVGMFCDSVGAWARRWLWEWNPRRSGPGWPEFCKVRYTVSDGGRNSGFAGRYPPDVVNLWEARFGDCWGLLHHHCGALLYLQRAKSAVNREVRKFALENAVLEDRFALRSCSPENPFYATIVTHLGLAFAEQGAVSKAEAEFDRSIATHPEYDGAYIAKASFLKKRGSIDAALAVLIEGSEATGGNSAELENALGLAYCDIKQYDRPVSMRVRHMRSVIRCPACGTGSRRQGSRCRSLPCRASERPLLRGSAVQAIGDARAPASAASPPLRRGGRSRTKASRS